MEVKGYRRERGMLWPEADESCARAVFATLPDLDLAIRQCKRRTLALQAGGNCGVWPIELAKHFDRVITFEPDAVNFTALAANTANMPNVTRFEAALGAEQGTVSLICSPKNCGAHYVDGRGSIPTMRIDDLGLDDCALIALDIEGMEFHALAAARTTITMHRPVIMIEDKGQSERFGVRQGYIEKWLASEFGYDVATRVHRDIILVPK